VRADIGNGVEYTLDIENDNRFGAVFNHDTLPRLDILFACHSQHLRHGFSSSVGYNHSLSPPLHRDAFHAVNAFLERHISRSTASVLRGLETNQEAMLFTI
jgi:hypothetical protein